MFFSGRVDEDIPCDDALYVAYIGIVRSMAACFDTIVFWFRLE
jgi:hypothetical protein